MLLAVPFGVAIGLVLGAIGGGGAILVLPVLVYALGERVGPASTASLAVVGLAAAGAGAFMARRGEVCWRLALPFSAAAATGAGVGAVGNRAVSGTALLLAFVPVVLGAAAAMWRRGGGAPPAGLPACPPVRAQRLVVAGAGVGALTGFFGVGGGFLIVPVLRLWLGMSMRRAIATSLAIISLTALAALAWHLLAGSSLDLAVTLVFVAATGAGSLVGAAAGRRVPGPAMARAFSLLLLGVAAFLLIDVIALGGPPGS